MVLLSKVKNDWGVPIALLLISAIPFVFGIVKMVEIAKGISPAENARFIASPVPVILHVITSSVFSVLGAFQFAPTFRRRNPRWHRQAGKIFMICGIASALTALWMNQFYVFPQRDTSPLLYAFRLFFGVAMIVFIWHGYTTIRRKDVMQHRASMARAYAIGAATGTQVIDHAVWYLFLPPPAEMGRAMLIGASFIINLAVAEWALHRSSRRVVRRAVSA